MAKLGQFQTPTGAKGNIFSLDSWVSMIVGAVVLIVTFAIGQDLAKKIGGVAPVDTTVDRPWKAVPKMAGDVEKTQQKGPSRVVL